jgi:hypothetical protein
MHQKHFDDIGGFRSEGDAGEKENGYTLSEGEDEWYKQHGCEAVKICAGKGDLICTSHMADFIPIKADEQCGTLERFTGMHRQ